MDIIVFGLGSERVPPFQGFLRTNLIVYLLDFLGDSGMSAFRHDTFS